MFVLIAIPYIISVYYQFGKSIQPYGGIEMGEELLLTEFQLIFQRCRRDVDMKGCIFHISPRGHGVDFISTTSGHMAEARWRSKLSVISP